MPATVTQDKVYCYTTPSLLTFSDEKERHDYKIMVGTPLKVEVAYYYDSTPEKHLAQWVEVPDSLTFMFVLPPKILDMRPDWAIINRGFERALSRDTIGGQMFTPVRFF